MPGLFGILDLTPKSILDEESRIIFEKMISALRHHDTDLLQQVYVSESNMLIGRVGLAYQNPYSWPIHSNGQESNVWIFVSGPLLERETDEPISRMPETIAFRQWHGFFSAVLVEPNRGTTLLLVDRKASMPIYYAQINDRLMFAPEVKALLVADHLLRKHVDLEAFATFLAQGFLLGDQTLFKAVRRLQGGELLRIKNGKVTKETYWRFLPGSILNHASQADLEVELGQLLNATVRRHMGEPEKTIIFLSGGVDSRGILGGALTNVQGHGERLNTVCWGESQGTKDSDVAIATLIARRLNTNHRFMQRKISNYRENFRHVNYLVDGLSDIAAFHPYEHQIMVELRNSGFERVLRGDEVFGLKYFSASTVEGASTVAYLRRLHGLLDLVPIIRKTRYDELCEASDAAIDKALSAARDLSPNQAKDFFYFNHRLQCYLQTASYYKQIELDHRNVLLDDSILDFLAKVPDLLRVDKLLFRRVVTREYPLLSQFPYAKRDNLEDWLDLLTIDSPVRKYAMDELGDQTSGVWEFLDPGALKNLITTLGKGFRFRSVLAQRLDPKPLVKQSLMIFAPTLLTRIRSQRRAHPVIRLGTDKIIMRALVLKNWYDTFA